jgi:hypothetical protein
MGQVWLADHKGLDIQVAVKFMRREVADDPVSVTRFEQEAKLSARIKSPHVVEVFDYDVTESGIPFIVMESLRGRDLETVLQNGKSLAISDAARVLVHVCKALSKAHSAGVIHRDIKAENVFVVQDEGAPLIKVLDFGVAKETSVEHGISLSGTTVGTPAYMSPEQLFHPKEIDLRTDLWATAVLVYRCLTGSFPFEGESFASVCLSVSKGKFAPPSAINSGLPAGLDAWFKRAFHKNLAARFASAKEMKDTFLNELHREGLLPDWAQGGGEDIAPVSSAVTPSAAWTGRKSMRHRGARRTRVAQIAAGVAMALLVAGAARMPTRAKVMGFAAVAAEHAHTWAVRAGFYPAALASTDDVFAPTSALGAPELTWLPFASSLAWAERDTEGGFAPKSPAGARSERAGEARRDLFGVARFDAPAEAIRGALVTGRSSDERGSNLAGEPLAADAPASAPESPESTLTSVAIAAPFAGAAAPMPASTKGASPPPSPPVSAPPATPPDLATVRFGL